MLRARPYYAHYGAKAGVVDPAEEPVPAHGRASAVAGAFLGLLEWWLEKGRDASPEEVDRIFQETVAHPGA